MPRHPRLFVAGVPVHIVQRGHDRQPVFVENEDFCFYLTNLVEAKMELSIRLLAYCLMTNHVHLVVVPGERARDVSNLMRIVAARQTRRVNKLENRSGTLWEGRYKASLIMSAGSAVRAVLEAAGAVAAARNATHTQFALAWLLRPATIPGPAIALTPRSSRTPPWMRTLSIWHSDSPKPKGAAPTGGLSTRPSMTRSCP